MQTVSELLTKGECMEKHEEKYMYGRIHIESILSLVLQTWFWKGYIVL